MTHRFIQYSDEGKKTIATLIHANCSNYKAECAALQKTTKTLRDDHRSYGAKIVFFSIATSVLHALAPGDGYTVKQVFDN